MLLSETGDLICCQRLKLRNKTSIMRRENVKGDEKESQRSPVICWVAEECWVSPQ